MPYSGIIGANKTSPNSVTSTVWALTTPLYEEGVGAMADLYPIPGLSSNAKLTTKHRRSTRPPFYRKRFFGGKDGWIYAAREEGAPLLKIGCTSGVAFAHIQRRLWGLKHQFHADFSLCAAAYVPIYLRMVEHAIHQMLHAEHIEKEWFYLHLSNDSLRALVDRALVIVTTLTKNAALHWEIAGHGAEDFEEAILLLERTKRT
jgi:T5orf172 domain